jgi:hypothetical protein
MFRPEHAIPHGRRHPEVDVAIAMVNRVVTAQPAARTEYVECRVTVRRVVDDAVLEIAEQHRTSE